jgi:colanic acid biosynthesis glycosyl transferase WcaI
MRILVVSQYFWPESFRINEIVQYLASRGHDVTVLTGKPNYPDGVIYPEFAAAPSRYSAYAGAKIVRVPHLPRGKGKITLLLNYLTFALSGLTFGTARLANRRFDVIFVCQLSPITLALPALLQKKLKRAPVVMWVLDLWPDSLAAVGVVRSKRALRWIERLVRFINQRCDRILVQSQSFVAGVTNRGGRPQDIFYFPAWAEAAFEAPVDSVAPAPELAGYEDTFNVIFAGNIGEAQDLPTVVEAASMLSEKQIRWFIAGDGRAAPGLREQIAKLGLTDRVIMLGRHPIEKMPSFFAAANVLLVSLKDEPVFTMTIPGKVQSYMSTGLPIVAMLGGEGAAIISKAQAGIVTPPGDARALAAAVSALAEMPDEARARLGSNGRAYCQREFDRKTLFARLEGWLEDLAAQNPFIKRDE